MIEVNKEKIGAEYVVTEQETDENGTHGSAENYESSF